MAKKKYTINLILTIRPGAGNGGFYYTPDIDEKDIGTDYEVRHFNLFTETCKIEVEETKKVKSSKKELINDTVWNDITAVNVRG